MHLFPSSEKTIYGLFVACAQAFGETRSTRSVIFLRTETRRVLENIGERGTENYLSLRSSLRRNTEDREVRRHGEFWKISEKGASAPLRAVARSQVKARGGNG